MQQSGDSVKTFLLLLRVTLIRACLAGIPYPPEIRNNACATTSNLAVGQCSIHNRKVTR